MATPSEDELEEERLRRQRTVQEVFEEGEWLTPDHFAALECPVSSWKRDGRVFSVEYEGREYFPRYVFDAALQPLPVVEKVLAAFGQVDDPWKLAAWFHYPSAWLVVRDEKGAHNVPPRDCLERCGEVVAAASKRSTSYVG